MSNVRRPILRNPNSNSDPFVIILDLRDPSGAQKIVSGRMVGGHLVGRSFSTFPSRDLLADAALVAEANRANDAVPEFDPTRFAADEVRFREQYELWQVTKHTADPQGIPGRDGPRPHVVAIDTDAESGPIEILLEVHGYAGFPAAQIQQDRVPLARRASVVSQSPMGFIPQFSRNAGINCSLVTADGFLVTTQRSQNVNDGKGLRSCAVGEGIDIDADVRDGIWMPEATIVRGFRDELGLVPGDYEFELYMMINQLDTGTVSIAAAATTHLTLAEVEARWRHAKERDESTGLTGVPFRSDEDIRVALLPDVPQTSWLASTTLAAAEHVRNRDLRESMQVGLMSRSLESGRLP